MLHSIETDSSKSGFNKKIVSIETVYDTEAIIEIEERRMDVGK